MVRKRCNWALAGLLGLAACTGSVDEGGDSTPPTLTDPNAVDPSAPTSLENCEPSVPPAPMRRLSRSEYLGSIADLFAQFDVPAPAIVSDPTEHGFENRAHLLNPSPLLIEQYGSAAENLGVFVAENLAAFLPCQPATAADEATCGQTFIETFGAKVLRRPLSVEEVADYVAFFETERANSNFQGAVQLTTEAFLQSPQFLYRFEFGDPASAEADRIKLAPYETASRLSYLIWDSLPDQALFDAAAQGALDTPDQREAQARRLLADPRAAQMLVEFHRQWLDFDKIDAEPKDPGVYPTYDDALKDAIREESDRFVASTLWQGDGRIASFFTSNKTQVNAPLAELYGVPAPAEDWVDVDLDPAQRAGWLTRSNFLASRAHKLEGSPPLRSVFILEKFFCQPPPVPPANADLTEPRASGGDEPKTNRELFEARIEPPVCNSCHSVIDTIGYGLENYDAVGAYRTLDNGQPVNAAGEIKNTDVDGPFVGGVELSQRLSQSQQVQECVAENWFAYASGRGLEPTDMCRLHKLNEAFAAAQGDVRELLVAIVRSEEFIYRPPIGVGP